MYISIIIILPMHDYDFITKEAEAHIISGAWDEQPYFRVVNGNLRGALLDLTILQEYLGELRIA